MANTRSEEPEVEEEIVFDPKYGTYLGPMEKVVSSKQLTETLECPICLEVPLPPILTCESGHIICNNCKIKVSRCSLCRGKILNIRNWTLEKIVNACYFKCINASCGCPEVLPGAMHREHFKSCDYRSVSCEQTHKKQCKGLLVPINEYGTHLKKVHEISEGAMKPSPDGIHTVMKTKLPDNREVVPFCMTFDNKLFLAQDRFHNGILFRWVQVIGTRIEAKQYIVHMLINCVENAGQNQSDAECQEATQGEQVSQVKWTFGVSHIHETFEEILESGKFAAFPVAAVKALSTRDRDGDGFYKVESKYVMVKREDPLVPSESLESKDDDETKDGDELKSLTSPQQ